MVEFAIVFGLLLMIALGAFEYGMLFRDWLSVTVSAREGARVAASAGTFTDADCVILDASAGALQDLSSGAVEHISIYRANDGTGSTYDYPGNGSSFTRRYRPAGSDTPTLNCGSGSQWIAVNTGSSYPPASRDNEGDDADWIGVRVEFAHDWLTDFLWWSGTANFADDAIFRLEPPAPD
jgi:hypothetical protein